MRIPLNRNISLHLSPAIPKLRMALEHPIGGVLVFWAPFTAGKSWALMDLTSIIQKEGGLAIYLNGTDAVENHYSSCAAWLKDSLHIRNNSGSISSLLPKNNISHLPGRTLNRTVIIIDHFDELMALDDTNEIIVGLARESFDTQKDFFSVLISVSRSNLVPTILDWNGRQKIRLICRPDIAFWNTEQMERVAIEFPSISSLPSDKDREDALRIVAKAGTPGQINALAYAPPDVRQTVLQGILDVWASGVHELKDLVYYC